MGKTEVVELGYSYCKYFLLGGKCK